MFKVNNKVKNFVDTPTCFNLRVLILKHMSLVFPHKKFVYTQLRSREIKTNICMEMWLDITLRKLGYFFAVKEKETSTRDSSYLESK